MIGRERGEALLAEHLGGARAGGARTVLTGGEAGVGKSRLLGAFTERARVAGAHVLSGTAEEHFGDPMPYGPVLDALEGLARDYGTGRADELGGPAYRM